MKKRKPFLQKINHKPMRDILKIALVQADPQFETIEGNLAYFEELIETEKNEADLFLLPELFNTGYKLGFTTRPETMGERTCRWMRYLSERKNAVLCGSIAIMEKGKVYNRMLFVKPNGEIEHYDKQNVFAFSGEDKVFTAGAKPVVFDYLGWKIKATICFDLRFPEDCRNQSPFYDLMICSAHWPSARVQAWDALLKARAIENQAYVAAVNRVGKEGAVIYTGHSVGYDFLGNPISRVSEVEEVQSFEVSKTSLANFRESFPFLKR